MLHSLRSHGSKQSASSVAWFSIRAIITCNSIIPNPPLPVRGTQMSAMHLFLCLQDFSSVGKCIFWDGSRLYSLSAPWHKGLLRQGLAAEALVPLRRCPREGAKAHLHSAPSGRAAGREPRLQEGTDPARGSALCPPYSCHCTHSHSLLPRGQLGEPPMKSHLWNRSCCVVVLPWTIENAKVTWYIVRHSCMGYWE